MRCFIAIPLSDNTHQELAQIQSQLKEVAADVGWVKIENIHLTLKFLGDIGDTKIKIIGQKLEELVKQYNCFETRMGELGVFPSFVNPKIIWMGINKNEDKINKLQQEIEEIMEPLGFKQETRAFSPHLTLGRVRSKKNIQKLTEKIKTLSFPQLKSIAVDKIIFFQSTLKPSRAEYNVLEEFKLMVDPVRDLKTLNSSLHR